jgi:hypothetical protein
MSNNNSNNTTYISPLGHLKYIRPSNNNNNGHGQYEHNVYNVKTPKWQSPPDNALFIGSVDNFIGPEVKKRELMEELCTKTMERIMTLRVNLDDFKRKYKADVFDKIKTTTGKWNAQYQTTEDTYEYIGDKKDINATSPFRRDYDTMDTELGLLYDNLNQLGDYNKNKNKKLKCDLETAKSLLFKIHRDLMFDINYKLELSSSLSKGGSRKRSLKKRKHSKCKRTRRR